jgi:hypothetical protein
VTRRDDGPTRRPRPSPTATAAPDLPDSVPTASEPRLARAQVRRQLRQVSRLRATTVIVIVLAVVGAPAAFFLIREFTRDPVFVELDGLDVPTWASGKHTDGAYGSRWCIRECRFRERTWESARGPEETNRAYIAALKRTGWTTWNVPNCQQAGADGFETCWQRDEYVLDLWVRAAVCEVKPTRPSVNPTAANPPPSGRATASPSRSPTAARSSAAARAGAAPGQAAVPAPSAPAAPLPASAESRCPGALATVKVFNRIMYQARQVTPE